MSAKLRLFAYTLVYCGLIGALGWGFCTGLNLHRPEQHFFNLYKEQFNGYEGRLDWVLTHSEAPDTPITGMTRLNTKMNTTALTPDTKPIFIQDANHVYIASDTLGKVAERLNIEHVTQKLSGIGTEYVYFNSLVDYENNTTLQLSEDLWLEWDTFVKSQLKQHIATYIAENDRINYVKPTDIVETMSILMGSPVYELYLEPSDIDALITDMLMLCDTQMDIWLDTFLAGTPHSLISENKPILLNYTTTKYTTQFSQYKDRDISLTWFMHKVPLGFRYDNQIYLETQGGSYALTMATMPCATEVADIPTTFANYQTVIPKEEISKGSKALLIEVAQIEENLRSAGYVPDYAHYTDPSDIRYTKGRGDGTMVHMALVPDSEGHLTNMRLQAYFPFGLAQDNKDTNFQFMQEMISIGAGQNLMFLDTLEPVYDQTAYTGERLWTDHLYDTHYVSLRTEYSPERDSLFMYATFSMNFEFTDLDTLGKEITAEYEASGEAEKIREKERLEQERLEKHKELQKQKEIEAQKLADTFSKPTEGNTPNSLWGIDGN